MSMPLLLQPKISQFSIDRNLPLMNRIPLAPALNVPPLNRMLRRMTTSVAVAATTIPLTPPVARVEATCPPPPSSVRDLVMVSAPNPPGSRASISPPLAVLDIAPAQVLHGAVRLHGLASSPTPETQVRVACACAGAIAKPTTNSAPGNAGSRIALFMRNALGVGPQTG